MGPPAPIFAGNSCFPRGPRRGGDQNPYEVNQSNAGFFGGRSLPNRWPCRTRNPHRGWRTRSTPRHLGYRTHRWPNRTTGPQVVAGSGQGRRKVARRSGSAVTKQRLPCAGPPLVTDACTGKVNDGIKPSNEPSSTSPFGRSSAPLRTWQGALGARFLFAKTDHVVSSGEQRRTIVCRSGP